MNDLEQMHLDLDSYISNSPTINKVKTKKIQIKGRSLDKINTKLEEDFQTIA